MPRRLCVRTHNLVSTYSRSLVTLILAAAVLLSSAPPTVARSIISATAVVTATSAASFRLSWASLTGLFSTSPQSSLPQEQRPRPQTYPASRPRSTGEREGRVRHLELNTPRGLTLQRGQRMSFTATPLDDNRRAVHGLRVKWESSDTNILFITPDGRALAGNAGRVQVRARAGNNLEVVHVTVVAATSVGTMDRYPRDAKQLKSVARRESREAGTKTRTQPEAALVERAHAVNAVTVARQQDPPALPAGDVGSLFEKRNSIGSPPDRYFPSALTSPAANRQGREMSGSDNYTFSVPITDLPGRGLDVALALTYNSSIWHKMGASGHRLQFDVGKSWPAPGFRLGYGYLESQTNGSFLLVDADGTRHPMVIDSPYPYPYPAPYITTDGTFIRSNGELYPVLTHTDGTKVFYGAIKYASGTTTNWPTKITDRHGNYLIINYVTDSYGVQSGPRITSIVDTLGRYISFKYDSNNNLVTVTAPGYANNKDRQEIRLYYETITDFTNKAKFASGVTVTNRPESIQVIKYIYYPGTQRGYRYDYSPYGMIREIVQLRGMVVSTASLNQIGTVLNEGQVAATTTYGYPQTTPPTGLSTAPTFTFRTDNWAGSTTGAATTTFEVGGTIKITAPDGSFSETSFDDGSDVTEVKHTVLSNTTTYARTKIEWETDSNGRNRRVKRVQTTTDAYLPTAKTRTIGYTYNDYNNIDEVIEYDFNTAPDTPGSILRRTKTTYVTDPTFPDRQAYINRNLVDLQTSVRVFAGSSTEPIWRVDYGHDGATPVGYSGYLGTGPEFIQNYDVSYDPHQPPRRSSIGYSTIRSVSSPRAAHLTIIILVVPPIGGAIKYRSITLPQVNVAT